MPEMLACLTKAGDGGNTRVSDSTDSICDDMETPPMLLFCCRRAYTPLTRIQSPIPARVKATTPDENPVRGPRPSTTPRDDLRKPLAAAAPLPGADRGAGHLCLAVLAGTLFPPARGLRQCRSAGTCARCRDGGRRRPP